MDNLEPMAQGVISLGAAPVPRIPCPRRQPGYAERSLSECQRFVAILSHVIGPEPEGACLTIRRSEPGVGSYLEVVIEYDNENTVARGYAIRCDREAPTRWE